MNRPHVLLVADWTVDPSAVVAAASQRRQEQPGTSFGILVPAWLHGLDWAGDPHASVPCACHQLAAIGEQATAAGLEIEFARVGDPDPATAIYDAVHDWHADEVLLCVRHHHLALRPFDLQHRAQRLIGLPVRRVGVRVPAAAAPRGRRGHCVSDPAPAA
jgi:hypothetical protein